MEFKTKKLNDNYDYLYIDARYAGLIDNDKRLILLNRKVNVKELLKQLGSQYENYEVQLSK